MKLKSTEEQWVDLQEQDWLPLSPDLHRDDVTPPRPILSMTSGLHFPKALTTVASSTELYNNKGTFILEIECRAEFLCPK